MGWNDVCFSLEWDDESNEVKKIKAENERLKLIIEGMKLQGKRGSKQIPSDEPKKIEGLRKLLR